MFILIFYFLFKNAFLKFQVAEKADKFKGYQIKITTDNGNSSCFQIIPNSEANKFQVIQKNIKKSIKNKLKLDVLNFFRENLN